MAIFTKDEINLILEKLHPHGGYSSDPRISRIQAKLSVLLEMAALQEATAQGNAREDWGR